MPLHVSLRAEALLGQRDRGLLALWLNSSLRHIWTDSLPRFLGLLQHASLLGQQELRSEFRKMKLTSDINLVLVEKRIKITTTKGAPFAANLVLCLLKIHTLQSIARTEWCTAYK